MDIKQQIIKETERRVYATEEQLATALGVKPKKLDAPLRELMEGYDLAVSRKGKIALGSTMGYYKGRLECKKGGFAFLRTPEGMQDIFVGSKEKNGAMDGEEVLVKLKHRQGGGHPEGKVVQILSQEAVRLVGTVRRHKKTAYVVPDDVHVEEVYLSSGDLKGKLKEGQKVVVELLRRAEAGRSAEGRVVELLGMAGHPGIDILSYARRFGLVAEFDKPCKAQADGLLRETLTAKGRKDLRNEIIFTIDGDDAKDLDDAVSLKTLPNGNYLLGVHIADVSHYVKEKTALDAEALRRGTSVYLLDRVVPMLPEQLSNFLCSLNPHEDKYTLSCLMEISKDGKLKKHELANTIIRSRHRMTYNNVNRILEGDKKMRDQYADITGILDEMGALAKTLRKRRFEKGSIDFDLNEASIALDEKGKPVAVTVRERGDAEKLIEEFMLFANITVAQHCYRMEMPFVYRIHEQPDADKMKELAVFLSNFGIRLHSASDIQPKDIQTVLNQVEGTPESNVVNSVTLRSLKKARYDVNPVGHFGLAAEQYCHFTSPIRRYPDLQVHRIVKRILADKMGKKAILRLEEELPGIAKQSSERERNAIEAERAVEDLKMAEYMAGHIGEEFGGVVSGVTKFGIFVELENMIEGMVPLSTLEDDYYAYFEKQYCVIGERTKKKITLGDKAKIKVVSADVQMGKIEFAFAE